MKYKNMKFSGYFKFIHCCLIVLLCGQISSFQDTTPKALVCYYDATSYWREGLGRFQANNINPSLCTHIIYSFLGLKDGKIYSRDPGLDLGPGEIEPNPDDELNFQGDIDMLRKTVQLQDENPNPLKILFSVGGPEQSHQSFSNMLTNQQAAFIESVTEFIQRFNLDGVDLFFEPFDEDNYVQLLKELKEALDSLSAETEKVYTITMPVGCTQSSIDVGYDIPNLSMYVDYFNVQCFDFKMFAEEPISSRKIGHHSPLRHKDSESFPDQQLTVSYGINYILQKGVPPEKLLLGVAAHARTYSFKSPQLRNFYDEAEGPGPGGEFTSREGFLAYFEICNEIKKNQNQWTFSYDYEYGIPYVKNSSMWIGYENEISVQEKVDFSLQKGLGGLMMKFIDLDDSKNICGSWYSFPIVGAIKDRLQFWDRKDH